MKNIIQIYTDWLHYYSDLNTFDPYNDAIQQTANHICSFKNWDYDRAVSFTFNLIHR